MADYTTTAQDLIQDAWVDAGIQAIGESMEAIIAQDGLRRLNKLIAAWSANNTLKPFPTFDTFFVTANPFPVPVRPMGYPAAWVTINGIDIPMRPISAEEWGNIPAKTLAGIPRVYWWDELSPNSNLYFYMVPTSGYSIRMERWDRLSQIASLTSIIGLPPEYIEALEYDLALRFCAGNSITPSPALLGLADESKAALRAYNVKAPLMTTDVRGVSARRGGSLYWQGRVGGLQGF